MENFNYSRIRQSFFSSEKSPELKREDMSEQIDEFLNVHGMNGEELVYYNEVMVQEGSIHITAVFKRIV